MNNITCAHCGKTKEVEKSFSWAKTMLQTWRFYHRYSFDKKILCSDSCHNKFVEAEINIFKTAIEDDLKNKFDIIK